MNRFQFFFVGMASLFSLAANPIHAQAINVTPITLAFDDDQRAALLTITNQGSVTSTVQVRPFEWQQTDGGNKLAATRELLVSPPMMQVAPGETQTIRVILKAPLAEKEKAYRLWIDQLPGAGQAGRINVLLRLSIPVFAAQSGNAHPDLTWHVSPGGAGSAALVLDNAGARHAHLTISSPEASLGAEAGNVYVLAGSTQRIGIERSDKPLRAGTTVTFVASHDASKSVVKAPVESP